MASHGAEIMRVSASFVELIAVGISTIAAIHSVQGLRGNLRAFSAMSHAKNSALPGSRLPTTGIGPWGRKIESEAKSSQSRLVVFLLRAASYKTDADYWNALSAKLAPSGLRFLAFCDGQECSEAARSTRLYSGDVLAFGQVSAMETVYRADTIGQAVVLSHGNVYDTIDWRGKDLEATASRLLELQ